MSNSQEQSAIQEKVLGILEEITGTGEIRNNLDLSLFDEYVLDSLGLVQLIVSLSETFAIKIAPAEVERDQWSSPRKIIENVEKRVAQK